MGATAQTAPSSLPLPTKGTLSAGTLKSASKTVKPVAKAAPEAAVIPDHDPTSLLAPTTPLREPEATEPGDVAVTAEAAETFIEGKRIGERIKYLRQRKHMGLVELGKHTGLSASFLSQLETGRVVPTLRNLARIAMVFSKDMSYFFEPERPELFRIVRAADRQRLPQTGAEEPGYYFESLGQVPADQPIAPYVTEFLPGNERNPPRAHRHTGTEFLYMLSGELQLVHESKVERLSEGDAVFFNAEAVHSYERVGETTCTALILTMPEPLRGTHTGSKLPLTKPAVTK